VNHLGIFVKIKQRFYQDSLKLMRISGEMQAVADVMQAFAFMGTDINKKTRIPAEILTAEINAAGANDLILMVECDNKETADKALFEFEARLSAPAASKTTKTQFAAVAAVTPSDGIIPIPSLFTPVHKVSGGLDTFNKPLSHSNPELQKKWNEITAKRYIIEAANQKAVRKVIDAQPVWVDVGLAIDVIPGFKPNTIVHAGPPVTWENMCGPMKGSVIGALIYEGKAATPEEAERLAASGEFEFVPCHHLGAVGPMTGVFTANMPVIVIENKENGNRAYSIFNTEGKGKPFSFGAYGQDTQERLQFIKNVMAPALGDAVRSAGGIDLKAIIAQALHMGDDCHNRLIASTGQLWKQVAIQLAKNNVPYDIFAGLAATFSLNNWFFLNFSMAACKASLDAARGIPGSTMLTAMARNGTEVGIQISGLDGQWFTAPAPMVNGRYFPGRSAEDANPDLGDSAITETAGIGAFAMANALGMTQLVGGTVDEAIEISKKMHRITVAKSEAFTVPLFNFEGTPTGIDMLKVLETGITPYINTGIAHKNPGEGIIGAGIVNMPIETFEKALLAFSI